MIQLSHEIKQYKETNILLCNLMCYDKDDALIYEAKEKVLYCKFRGLYAEKHYTRHVPRAVKYKFIQIKPVRIIGTGANK